MSFALAFDLGISPFRERKGRAMASAAHVRPREGGGVGEGYMRGEVWGGMVRGKE